MALSPDPLYTVRAAWTRAVESAETATPTPGIQRALAELRVRLEESPPFGASRDYRRGVGHDSLASLRARVGRTQVAALAHLGTDASGAAIRSGQERSVAGAAVEGFGEGLAEGWRDLRSGFSRAGDALANAAGSLPALADAAPWLALATVAVAVLFLVGPKWSR